MQRIQEDLFGETEVEERLLLKTLHCERHVLLELHIILILKNKLKCTLSHQVMFTMVHSNSNWIFIALNLPLYLRGFYGTIASKESTKF